LIASVAVAGVISVVTEFVVDVAAAGVSSFYPTRQHIPSHASPTTTLMLTFAFYLHLLIRSTTQAEARARQLREAEAAAAAISNLPPLNVGAGGGSSGGVGSAYELAARQTAAGMVSATEATVDGTCRQETEEEAATRKRRAKKKKRFKPNGEPASDEDWNSEEEGGEGTLEVSFEGVSSVRVW
jgi:hypothetical protein